jgi:hypothetical protein
LLAREIAKAADIHPMKVLRENGQTRIDGATVAMPAPPPEPSPAPAAAGMKKGATDEPEFDAQIEEVRTLTAARAVLADIRKLIARLREHPDELSDIHPKIEARLARLRSTAVTLPPEFASLTGRLDDELRAIVAQPSEDNGRAPLA